MQSFLKVLQDKNTIIEDLRESSEGGTYLKFYVSKLPSVEIRNSWRRTLKVRIIIKKGNGRIGKYMTIISTVSPNKFLLEQLNLQVCDLEQLGFKG